MQKELRCHLVRLCLVLVTVGGALAAGGGVQGQSGEWVGYGPSPTLPPPRTPLIPTITVVDAKGWSSSATPVPAEGIAVVAFARGLDHPRWLHVLPNGDVLVAETNAPPRPDEGTGFKGWFFKHFQQKAGGAVPSANRITLLRDRDGDGVAETRFAFLTNLNSPFGMALVGDVLYVANTDAVVAFPYSAGADSITAPGRKIVDLPAGMRNHHWTKSLIANPDGTQLYVGVGSNSNAAEHGMAEEEGRAAIWEIDPKSGSHRMFATGLRNPVGMAWEPETGALWTAVNERDELGNDLVPDYITSVRESAFYGWPYSYYGDHVDSRVKPERPDLIARAVVPDYAVGAHTASLGLAYSRGTNLPRRFDRGMFVGQHGSWNRSPRSGYKVIFVPFVNGRPEGMPIDVLTGFVSESGDGWGRPVGVAIDRQGSLLVADDIGNTVWRVSGTNRPRVTAAQ
jgi:glucose/arabinose dehydrogenase